MGEPGASVDALVLLRWKTGPLCTSWTRSCLLPVPHSLGPNDMGEDKCFPAYVRNITLHVHNLNIMQRFIKFYFPSSPRRTFQLSWAVHFFFPIFVFCLSNCVICVFHFTHSFTILLLGTSIKFLFKLFCSSVPRFLFESPLYLLFLCRDFLFFHLFLSCLQLLFEVLLDVYFKIFIT